MTEEESKYQLSRDYLASGRLTAQHYLILRRSGWLLHPEIASAVSGRTDLAIADLACGNAIWALDMASEFPDATVVGIDISTQQFPTRASWPHNLCLETHDMFQAVPEKYVGRFDVVHIRLVLAAVYNHDKDRLLQNVLTLLKPGGYIQWTEALLPVFISPIELSASSVFRQPSAIETQCRKLVGGSAWLVQLHDEFQARGLTNTQRIRIPLVPWLSKQDNDNTLGVMDDILRSMQSRAPKAVVDEHRAIIEETVGEMGQGRMFFANYYTAIGRSQVE
ncbi:hypothetical protein LTR20_001722 [Exophiala xenobiotica]|nr:hypothetical protein LTS13_010684 [Exophiala xenobiotica]KAK5393640.1 hypothetical protein LTR79_009308 [Exophiala xenobiotica]KAK5405860.1 hypothetical protein LTR90_010798 [Exophiala xenobiotica]KAK5469212.1 hypothetical protein LTR20_001722 [Exophiala xenobiotica]KAK5476281.1 hypothetical protein LTR26_008700 [Exophiala xenobiotica]